ncbi:MAG: rhodanese-like domain-containing protein [Pyrinomonadaceae bacterium MAG19_C2-C3]|nr:rhodanese-like domain-containing protein [Pyrinomonadaceae bacterium MAG19_C2-C3]
MRRFILPVCAAFALAACSQPDTERQSNSNGNRNASAPTHGTTSTGGAANANNTTNTTNTSQNGAASTAQPGRITIEEARELVAQNKAVIVDVRGDSSYNTSHIKGSISIPGGDIAARAKELPKDKKIITYCS